MPLPVDNATLLQEKQDEIQLWRDMASLEASDPLPSEMPQLLYSRLGSLMRFCDYPERLAPFFQHFPAEKYPPCHVIHLMQIQHHPFHLLNMRFTPSEPHAIAT